MQLGTDRYPFLEGKPARQQPDWNDRTRLQLVREELASSPGLVHPSDIAALRSLLAHVASGLSHVIQAGDCAEDPAECTPDYVARKAGLLEVLAGTMRMHTHKPVVRVGRLAGQYAKPRSQPSERAAGEELLVYRGHMVNSPEPDPVLRLPDPLRVLACYQAASQVMSHLGWRDRVRRWESGPHVWTSHEALLLDYEVPLLRRDDEGRLYLASTHWPWIGNRTHQLDGAHVALLAAVSNPVACKVGTGMTPGDLVALCAVLDPDREPGRLTLIARMGAPAVAERLPHLVQAVRAAGHPVIWLCDPMHGNTLITSAGLKTRYVKSVLWEAEQFQCAVSAFGGTAGGLHLEITPDAVTECVMNESHVEQVGEKYTTLCDPRLNPGQAASVVATWRS
ncbi:phospho-2-dehydro-3-deoxyheptonate aldolase [Streptomyces sp. IMTB 2501]|uniref:3-deoxy-7-phosphoheptulonate synthase n=1 Tax=Streptomyces sp. IMTB 2501 TaxID=1776340 RepID=UPI00096E1062|nr:3-deoxy-7-phosphoheptulonate synthase [Streptomyces sp. IMTB 2501]OLZ60595.1 phospho-2-dehydro-3-deoxyheptonate aldolase [Streptomyces sp. IMTB 2501]